MKPEDVGKYMGEIGKGVKDLALQMKQPVEEVYGLFLRQNYVKGFVSIFWILLSIVGLIVCINLASRFNKITKKWNNDATQGLGLGIFILSVCVLAGIILSLTDMETIISRFINPHYMTIKDIIELVKPK